MLRVRVTIDRRVEIKELLQEIGCVVAAFLVESFIQELNDLTKDIPTLIFFFIIGETREDGEFAEALKESSSVPCAPRNHFPLGVGGAKTRSVGN
jgi:hypothetical protein